jgi:Uncharacterized enzyme of heme biosynthesis
MQATASLPFPAVRIILPALLLFVATSFSVAESTGAEDQLAAARKLIEASRLPEAREPLETVLRRDPQNLEAALALSEIYHALGRRDQAIDLLEPFLKKHPDHPGLLAAYAGQCMLRAGELGPGFRTLRLARRGRELMELAVALAPDDIGYRESLVNFYREAPSIAGGDPEKARRHAEAIARLDPVRGAAWRASLFVQEKKFSEALAACDSALAAQPDDYDALFILGRTVAETGLRLDDGEAALRRCLAGKPGPAGPGHALVWFRLGMIAEHRNDRAAARAAYEESLKLEPNFRRATEALNRLEKQDRAPSR